MNSADVNVAKIAYESFDQLSDAELNRKTKAHLNTNEKDSLMISMYQSGLNRLNLDLDGYDRKQHVICLSTNQDNHLFPQDLNEFNEPLVAEQVDLYKLDQYTNVYKNGYPNWIKYIDILYDYNILHPDWHILTKSKIEKLSLTERKKNVLMLMNQFGIETHLCLFGDNNIFMKDSVKFHLNQLKIKMSNNYTCAAIKLQSYTRMQINARK